MKNIEKLICDLIDMGVYTQLKIMPKPDGKNRYSGVHYEVYISSNKHGDIPKPFLRYDTIEECEKRLQDFMTDSKQEIINYHKEEIERFDRLADSHREKINLIEGES